VLDFSKIMEDMKLVNEASQKIAESSINNNSSKINASNARSIQSKAVSSSLEPADADSEYNKCYTARNLFDIFSFGDTINKTAFASVCSSLVYMTVKSSCQEVEAEDTSDRPTAAQSMPLIFC
jgi:hypothetical protein